MNGKVVSVIQNQKITGDDKLQEILDSLPHGVAVFNQQLILTQWNKKLLILLNLEKDSFEIATNLNDILHINWLNQKNDGRNSFAAKIIYELSKAKTSDELFPFSYEYHISQEKNLDIKGEVMPNAGMILTFSDITLRSNPNYYLQSTPAPHEGDISNSDELSILEARSDREIMEQEAVKAIQMAEDLAITREIAENTAKHIEAILNAISDVLITMDAKGNILTCNHAVKNMFGYSSLELIGKNLLYILKTTQVISEKDFEIFITSLEEEEQLKKHNGTGFKNCGTAFPVELNIREVNISGEKQFTIVISEIRLGKKYRLL